MAAGDGSAAANDTEAAPGATTGWGARIRRSRTLLLEIGGVAAALGSILGLVVFFVPALDLSGGDSADKVVTVLGDGAEIGLAVGREVESLTYGQWLELETGSTEGTTPEEQRVRGVNVHYRAEFPAYAHGAPFRARFTLVDQTNATRHTHTTEARLDADRDTCRCAEFVPVPAGAASYRVLVELFRPGAEFAAPVLGQRTDWFTAAEPVNDG